MRAQTRPSDDRRNRAIEDVHEPPRILSIRVTAHRRFVHADLATARGDERLELRANDGHQCLGECPAIRIAVAWHQPAAQGVRPGHTGLERDGSVFHRRVRRVQPLQAIELLNHTEAARSLQRADDAMPAALVVRRGTEPPGDDRLGIHAVQESIERQVEVQARLFPIGHDIQTSRPLIVQRTHHRIVLRLGKVGGSESIEVLGGELQPTGKRIAADDRRAQGVGLHQDWLGRIRASYSRWARFVIRQSSIVNVRVPHRASPSDARAHRRPTRTVRRRARDPGWRPRRARAAADRRV